MSCQKFQQGRQLARLFEVSPPRNEGTQEEGCEDSDVQRALEASFQQSSTALQKA